MPEQITERDGVNDTHHSWYCPNCAETHTTQSEGACFVEMLAVVLRDRGSVSNEAIARACEELDVDDLWTRFGGPATDWLEDRARETDWSEP